MYIGSYAIDDLLTFYVQTQVFASGVASDADGVPTYRVYEDETTAPILTGSMALLDASNTNGLYSEQITLSAANGFEKGKCYAIHIKGTTSSVAGATLRFFQMYANVDAKYHGGTSQTGRDIGASVLLSSGTGTGQLDFTSGVVKANLVQTLASALSGTASLIAAGFSSFFGVASPTATVANLPRIITAPATAQGGTNSTITLVNTESTTASWHNGNRIKIVSGTGAGQSSRIITAYSTGRVATVAPDWVTAPDNTSVYLIEAFGAVPVADPVTNTDLTTSQTVITDAISDLSDDVADVPDVNEIATTLLDTSLATHNTSGTVGEALTNSASSTIATDVTQILANTVTINDTVSGIQADLPIRFTKNVALADFPFRMVDTDGEPVTGLSVSAYRVSGSTRAAMATSVSETGNGWYRYSFSTADTNFNAVGYEFSATGAVTIAFTVTPNPT